jgi:hypothetical protein
MQTLIVLGQEISAGMQKYNEMEANRLISDQDVT